jgi:hypothetical protein
MGYRIHYSLQEGTLAAVVSGKSTLAAAGCIARDIAAQAAREAAAGVLIDLRWLEDRVGTLRALLSLPALRVAVVDIGENDPYYVFSEREQLKYFGDTGSALRWLKNVRSGDSQSPGSDRNRPTPAGAPARASLAINGG